MAVGGKRRAHAKRGKVKQQRDRDGGRHQSFARPLQPAIVYWDVDSVSGDGSTEETYEIAITQINEEGRPKRKRTRHKTE